MENLLKFRGVDAHKPFSHETLLSYGKVAYLDCWNEKLDDVREAGEITEHFLYQDILEYIDVYDELDRIVLEDYAAVIIPASMDEVYLHRFTNKIRAYLDNGGVIISFMQNYSDILPGNAVYTPSSLPIKDREVQFGEGEGSRIIFEGIREYDINYRRGVKGFFNLGYFDLEGFSAEERPEILLKDNEGKCVAYVDRISTNGVILATAGADLIAFGLFENTTARRMGPGLFLWLEKELQRKDFHSLRKARKYKNEELDTKQIFDKGKDRKSANGLKCAIITGGSGSQRRFFINKGGKYAKAFDCRVYAPELEQFRFEDYDYVVLSSSINRRFLRPHKEKIRQYLEQGGHIVSLGSGRKEFLPNIRWRSYPTNFWWWRIEGADLPLYAVESLDGGKTFVKQTGRTREGLFSKMDVRVAKWHYHGAFYPPEKSQIILVNELDEAIIYKDLSHKGNLYVMSLDPDLHIGMGFMPTTEPFLDSLLEWIEEDILSKSE